MSIAFYMAKAMIADFVRVSVYSFTGVELNSKLLASADTGFVMAGLVTGNKKWAKQACAHFFVLPWLLSAWFGMENGY